MTHISKRAAGPLAALVLFVGWLCAAPPAHAICPINQPDCHTLGHVTWTHTLTLSQPARGVVTSDPAGIDCGSGASDCAASSSQTTPCVDGDCADPDPNGWTHFTLTPTGPSGFSPSWTGCDSVTSGQCSVYLDADKAVSVNWIDVTDPVVDTLSVTNAVNGRVGRVANVLASAADNDAVSRIEIFVGNAGTPVLTRTSDHVLSGTIDLSGAGFADGSTVTLRARAMDASGRLSADRSVTVTIDKSVSETVGSVPAFTNAATVPVTIATDPDAALSCSTGGARTIAAAPCSGRYSPLTAASPDGDYTYSITATDAVGNVAVQRRSFTLDRTPPRITNLGGPPQGGRVSTTSVTVAFAVTDANLDGVTCRLDGGAAKPCSGSMTLSGLAPGTHRLTIEATDKAGNTATVSRTFSVAAAATTPPPATAHLRANPARLVYRASRHGAWTRLRVLKIVHAVRGSRITVHCKGRGCPAGTLLLRARHSTIKLTSLQKRALRPGAVVTIRIAKPGLRTRTVRIRVRYAAPSVSARTSRWVGRADS